MLDQPDQRGANVQVMADASEAIRMLLDQYLAGVIDRRALADRAIAINWDSETDLGDSVEHLLIVADSAGEAWLREELRALDDARLIVIGLPEAVFAATATSCSQRERFDLTSPSRPSNVTARVQLASAGT